MRLRATDRPAPVPRKGTRNRSGSFYVVSPTASLRPAAARCGPSDGPIIRRAEARRYLNFRRAYACVIDGKLATRIDVQLTPVHCREVGL